MAKNFKKTAIKTEKKKKKFKKSDSFCHNEEKRDSSVITSSLAIPPSLRGAKRRSNPKRERACTGLPRPKGLAMSRTLCVLTKFCFAKLASMTCCR